jgi:ABC-type nitrate/sulfonate/bicarbonate transport system substrate-binding protein
MIGLAIAGGMAVLGSMSVRNAGKSGKAGQCAWDGVSLRNHAISEAYLADRTCLKFCSVECARQYFSRHRNAIAYVTVTDTPTGKSFDSSLGWYVAIGSRTHAFSSRAEAERFASIRNGRIVENPFGREFVVPEHLRVGTVRVSVPELPDALPFRLGIHKPIFRENLLEVHLSNFNEDRIVAAAEDPYVQGLVCDLPAAIVLVGSGAEFRIIKNILRANPFRPLYALVGASGITDVSELSGGVIGIPRGLSYRFYADLFLDERFPSATRPKTREFDSLADVWKALEKKEISAAVLRTPFTEAARHKNLALLASDRNMPWMSALLMRESIIASKKDMVRKFVFALEQSILALNIKPDEFRDFLIRQPAIPAEIKSVFPMPIFEGANTPAQDEIKPVMDWLIKTGRLKAAIPYEHLVNSEFLPDPSQVGLAFCCQ